MRRSAAWWAALPPSPLSISAVVAVVVVETNTSVLLPEAGDLDGEESDSLDLPLCASLSALSEEGGSSSA